jgi:cytochrome c-type biogenesis protein CcmH
MLARLVIAVLFALLPAIARADALDDGVRRVALQLQCPVCEGETVADSNSGLAADMRSLIRTRLEGGASDQQILDEFIASYGDSILTEPPKHGISLGVWLGPAVGLILGVCLVTVVLISWRRPGAPSAPPATGLDPEVANELRRFRGEYG